MRRMMLILSCAALLALLQGGPVRPALAGVTAPWVESYNSKVRLLAGTASSEPDAPMQVVAGVEIRMAPGWKTYWRMPGDAGGVPPQFNWSASVNLASDSVVFPVAITAQDPSRPVELRLSIEYGICREICVPAEANLELSLPPDPSSLPDEVESALAIVPRAANERRAGDPVLKRVEAQLTGDKPRLILEAAFPGGSQLADLFVEGPEDIHVAMPTRTAEHDGLVRFEIDLTDGVEPEALKGKTLLATMVSETGQSEAGFTVE